MMEKSGSSSSRKAPWLGGSSPRDCPLSCLSCLECHTMLGTCGTVPGWDRHGAGTGEGTEGTGGGHSVKGLARAVVGIWNSLEEGHAGSSKMSQISKREIFVLVLQEQQQCRERGLVLGTPNHRLEPSS